MTQPRKALTTVQILLIGAGTLVVLLCGIGAVAAVLPDRDTVDYSPPAGTTAAPIRPSPPTVQTTTPAAVVTSTAGTTTTRRTTTTTTTTTKKATTTTANQTVTRSVTPGAFCSEHWWYGHTSTGKLMRCKPSSTDTRFRWRAA